VVETRPIFRWKTADKVPENEQEQQIYQYVLKNGSITTTKAMEFLNLKQRRSREIIAKMIDDGWLRKEGSSRSTVYVYREH
jgi:predicted HTH transcriptional regulator